MDEALKKEVQPIYEQIGALVQASQQMEFSIGFSLTLLNHLNSGIIDDDDASIGHPIVNHNKINTLQFKVNGYPVLFNTSFVG